MSNAEHMFETTEGDEVGVGELINATWKVVETFLDIDEGTPVFTHRIEPHMLDDLLVAEIDPRNLP